MRHRRISDMKGAPGRPPDDPRPVSIRLGLDRERLRYMTGMIWRNILLRAVLWWERLRARRHGEGIYYINGADTLPPPLSPAEEADAIHRAAEGDGDARDLLITHNLRLVVYIARKFESSGVGIEDLISIGTIGLIKAINTFCPGRNIKLATYSSRCIENEILMYLRKNTQLRNELSIDEPLNVDWDGNELLLSDILGSDPDLVNRNIEQEAAAFRYQRKPGAYPEGGGRSPWHLAVLHIPAGKKDHQTAQKGHRTSGITAGSLILVL